MNFFKRLNAYLRLREAVRQANEAWQRTGKRHYVMPTMDRSRKLIIMDRQNFRRLKRKGYIDNSAAISDMIAESFYFTPCTAYGDGYLSDRDRRRKTVNYYSWVEAEYKAAREERRLKRRKRIEQKKRMIADFLKKILKIKEK